MNELTHNQLKRIHELIAMGWSNAEIADTLAIPEDKIEELRK